MKRVKLFEQFVNEDSGRDTLGELAEMTMGQLERIEDYAEMISGMMEEGKELESWMFSQITVALENLNAVHDTLKVTEEIDESTMSDIHQLAGEVKSEDEFVKKFFKEYGAKIKKTSDSIDWVKSLYKDTVNESLNEEKAKGDRGAIDNDAIETGLKNKSKESGVPLPLLRIIMRRGMDAWNSSHYEGATQEQWGYARINAFLEKGKGTWGGADADVAKEVRDGGHDKKLPFKSKED